jgi:antitoxin component YwqK of YwqJK toxin-antitoxin module/predicted RNA-binding Zn-ribbon protein involved in translation (DUF1610 family)
MAEIDFVCPECGGNISADEKDSGMSVNCPLCNKDISIPFFDHTSPTEKSNIAITAHKETANCPFCGEEILAVAVKCKHCGEFLNKNPYKQESPEKPKKSKLAIVAFILAWTSILLSFFTGLPAMIIAVIADRRIRKSDGKLYGRNWAWWGFGIALTLTIASFIWMSAVAEKPGNEKRVVLSENPEPAQKDNASVVPVNKTVIYEGIYCLEIQRDPLVFAFYDNGVEIARVYDFLFNKIEGNIPDGIVKQYDKDKGYLACEINYRNNRLNGPCKSYHENGNIWMESVFESGIIYSDKMYDENGNLASICIWRNGKIAKRTYYYDNGQVERIEEKNENEYYSISYFEDGKIKGNARQVNNHCEEVEYSENGKVLVKKDFTYLDNKTKIIWDGYLFEYDNDGNITGDWKMTQGNGRDIRKHNDGTAETYYYENGDDVRHTSTDKNGRVKITWQER